MEQESDTFDIASVSSSPLAPEERHALIEEAIEAIGKHASPETLARHVFGIVGTPSEHVAAG
jgi:hypothetical protein